MNRYHKLLQMVGAPQKDTVRIEAIDFNHSLILMGRVREGSWSAGYEVLRYLFYGMSPSNEDEEHASKILTIAHDLMQRPPFLESSVP